MSGFAALIKSLKVLSGIVTNSFKKHTVIYSYKVYDFLKNNIRGGYMLKVIVFFLCFIFSLKSFSQVVGTGTPPDLPKTLNAFGANLKWQHSLKDADGNAKSPDGYIIYYASKQADLNTTIESKIGVIDPSKFASSSDPTQFTFKMTQIADLLAKKSCFQMTAYYTYNDNGTPIRVESDRSNIICKTITVKPANPLVLTVD